MDYDADRLTLSFFLVSLLSGEVAVFGLAGVASVGVVTSATSAEDSPDDSCCFVSSAFTSSSCGCCWKTEINPSNFVSQNKRQCYAINELLWAINLLPMLNESVRNNDTCMFYACNNNVNHRRQNRSTKIVWIIGDFFMHEEWRWGHKKTRSTTKYIPCHKSYVVNRYRVTFHCISCKGKTSPFYAKR